MNRTQMLETGWKNALLSVPSHLRTGLRLYATEGVRPGGFLCAVIEKDFDNVIVRSGDNITLFDIRAIHAWLFNFAPDPCWGSKKKREAWQLAFTGDNPIKVHT